jgi:hypothetical protein
MPFQGPGGNNLVISRIHLQRFLRSVLQARLHIFQSHPFRFREKLPHDDNLNDHHHRKKDKDRPALGCPRFLRRDLYGAKNGRGGTAPAMLACRWKSGWLPRERVLPGSSTGVLIPGLTKSFLKVQPLDEVAASEFLPGFH